MDSARKIGWWTGCVFVVLSCTASTVGWGRTLAEIKKTKELRVCFSSFPGIVSSTPLGCVDDCSWKGPAYDVAQAFVKTLDFPVAMKTRAVDWDMMFADEAGKVMRGASYVPKLFADGVCDVFPSNLARTPWRDKLMDFAVLFRSRMMVLTRKADKALYRTEKDLSGKTAVLKKDTSFHTWVDSVNNLRYRKKPIKMVFAATGEDEYDIVSRGQGDFTLADADMAFSLTKTSHKGLAAQFTVGDVDEIGWGIPKDAPQLREVVQRFFDEDKKLRGSEINLIWLKYFGLPFNEFEAIVKAI